MTLNISDFRNVTGANRVLVDNNQMDITAKGSWSIGKAVTWIKDLAGGQNRVQENTQARTAFYQALVKAEGQAVADQAMNSVLGRNWQQDTSSLSGKNIRQVLDKSAHIRMETMGTNRWNAQIFANGSTQRNHLLNNLESHGLADTPKGGRYLYIDIAGTPFGNVVAQHRQEKGYPAGEGHDRKLYEAFMKEVTRDPHFANQLLSQQELSAIADRVIDKYYNQVQNNFDKEYPGISEFLQQHSEDFGITFRSPSMVPRLTEQVRRGGIDLGDPPVQLGALEALGHLQNAKPLLSGLSFNHETVTDQLGDIQDLSNAVQRTRQQLDNIQNLAEMGQIHLGEHGSDLLDALHTELGTLNDRLESKRQMLTEFKQSHPFSEKNVSYTQYMLAQTGLESARHELGVQMTDLNQRIGNAPIGSEKRAQLQNEMQELQQKSVRIMHTLENHVNQAENAYLHANPDTIIPRDQVQGHALFQTEKNELRYVKNLLKEEGLEFTDPKHAFADARDRVLNTQQDWSPMERTIVTQEGQTTRVATSSLSPARTLEDSYVQHQLEQASLRGVSSHTKTEAAPTIPKNLQHSTLEVDGKNRVDMIRHGIIANTEQAKSVVSTAISSDPHLHNYILDQMQNHGEAHPTIDYSFSNVNLESPWGKHTFMGKRRALQDTHIESFKALANATQPVEIPYIGPNGQETTIRVNLKLSIMAIPVNNAVGTLGTVGGVWSHVEKTNREGLQNLVGDLGDPKKGVNGSARGTAIGGMVGEITAELDDKIDELSQVHNPNLQQQAHLAELKELRANIQESVDIVRDMYCSGDYKENDGNRYKFALAVMFATNLAKQAHTALGISENGSGFGSSQGCMSNKDRGGNADALLKSLNLSAENAFKLLRYNTNLSEHELVSMLDILPPEDAKNMLVMGLVYTGQLEAQQMQTLVMGSKNAGDLMEAIKNDPEAYPILKGLSQYAKA